MFAPNSSTVFCLKADLPYCAEMLLVGWKQHRKGNTEQLISAIYSEHRAPNLAFSYSDISQLF